MSDFQNFNCSTKINSNIFEQILLYCVLVLCCSLPNLAIAANACNALFPSPMNASEGPSTLGAPYNFLIFSGGAGAVTTFSGGTLGGALLMTEGTEGSNQHFQNFSPFATCNGATCVASGEFAGTSSLTILPAFVSCLANSCAGPCICNVGNCNPTNPTVTSGQVYTSVTVLNGTMQIGTGASCSGDVVIGTLTLAQGSQIKVQNNCSYNLWVRSLIINNPSPPNPPFTTTTLVMGNANSSLRFIVANSNTSLGTSGQTVNWNTAGTASQLIYYQSQACGGNVLGFGGTFNMNGLIMSEIPVAANGSKVTISSGAMLTRSIDVNGSNPKFSITYPAGGVVGFPFGPITCTLLSTTGFNISAPSCTSNCCGPVTMQVKPVNLDATQNVGYQKMIVLSTNESATCATAPSTCSSSVCPRTCTAAGGVSGCVGNWALVSGSGTFTAGAANSGYATYLFSPSDTTPPTFSLTYPNAGTPNILIYELNRCNKFVADTRPATITFAGSGTGDTFTWGGFSSPQVGGVTVSNITLTAIKPASCGGGTDTSYTGCKALKFSSAYNNPTTGTVAVQMTAPTPDPNSSCTPLPTYPVSIPTSGAPSSAVINVKFTNGVGTLPNVTYNDVGQITLNVIDTGSGGINCGTFCSSGAVVFQPQLLQIGSGVNGCNTPGCAVFTSAGTAFGTQVSARINGGGIAPNFGNESPQQVPTLTATLNAPAGGNFPAGVFSAGTPTFGGSGSGLFNFNNVVFNEVGAINMTTNIGTPTLGQYLGTTLPASALQTLIVGRFQPHHFVTVANSPSISPTCSTDGFNYFQMPNTFSVPPTLTVTATNLSGGTTLNYTGAWASLTPASMNSNTTFGQSAQATLFNQTTQSTSLVTPSITGSWPTANIGVSGSNGVFAVNFNNTPTPTPTFMLPYPASATTIYQGNSANTGFFVPNISMSVAVKDADSTNPVSGIPANCVMSGPGASNSCSSGGGAGNVGSGLPFSGGGNSNQYLQGRLVLFNTAASNIVGSTTLMPVQVQYFTHNSGYTVNPADSTCTPLANNPANYCINNTAPCNFNPPQPLTPASIQLTGNLHSGANVVVFGAPSPQATGQTNFQLLLDSAHLNLPWLQSNWGAGAYANPTAQITWGYSPGTSSRTIYEQENY